MDVVICGAVEPATLSLSLILHGLIDVDGTAQLNRTPVRLVFLFDIVHFN